jgi:hypothetical protein
MYGDPVFSRAEGDTRFTARIEEVRSALLESQKG